MAVTLWWVRHGPTHGRGMLGWTDIAADLSDTAAIARLSAALPADASVVSSDLIRAVATADALAGSRPRLPAMPDLREINFGAWEGRTGDAIAADEPERSFAFWDTPGDVAPDGGESWNALAARVSGAADILAMRGGDVIVVAHMGPILTQIGRATGAPNRDVLAHKIDHLSMSRLTYDGAWHIGPINVRP